MASDVVEEDQFAGLAGAAGLKDGLKGPRPVLRQQQVDLDRLVGSVQHGFRREHRGIEDPCEGHKSVRLGAPGLELEQRGDGEGQGEGFPPGPPGAQERPFRH